jgi:hypothetical protein
VTITNNTAYNLYGKGTDIENPHCDFVQILHSAQTTGTWTGVTVSDNLFVQPYTSRGDAQGIFCDSPDAAFVRLTAENNLIVNTLVNGLAVYKADTCTIKNNTVVRPDAGIGSTIGYLISIAIGSSTSTGTHDIQNNVSEAVTIAGSTTGTINNVALGLNGATIPYSSAFTGSGGNYRPTSVADAVAIFQPKPAGPLVGPPVVGFTGP